MSHNVVKPDILPLDAEFSIALHRGGRVVLEFQLASEYEAAIAYQDLVEALKTGQLNLKLDVGRR